MIKSAWLSDCGVYRYSLNRTWDTALPVLMVVMVNPSTADADIDDPTILTLIARARLWGFGGIRVVNLFSLRSSTPGVLAKNPNAFGPLNADALTHVLQFAERNDAWILAAWGNNCMVDGGRTRDMFMLDAKGRGVELRCLGTTLAGHPKHPLARGVHRVPMDFIPVTLAA